jgi:hypothetical protein
VGLGPPSLSCRACNQSTNSTRNGSARRLRWLFATHVLDERSAVCMRYFGIGNTAASGRNPTVQPQIGSAVDLHIVPEQEL